jgi:uncharacterized protein YndB with AHSA1/START domain
VLRGLDVDLQRTAVTASRSISRAIELPLTPEAAFALLHTPSDIRAWWSAARAMVAPREGGIWVAAWGPDEDAPEYITAARILVWDPPHRLRLGRFEYFTRDGGLPFTADLETEFTVQPRDRGSLLRVDQVGFPVDSIADGFFAACEAGWKATLDGVARYAAEERAAG